MVFLTNFLKDEQDDFLRDQVAPFPTHRPAAQQKALRLKIIRCRNRGKRE